MSSHNISVDVAVIGAGFSGLQAALHVHKADLSCIVVEAHDRIGGKSLTAPLNSRHGIVEMDPTWINNHTQPRMATLAEDYGLATIEQYTEGLTVTYTSEGVAHTSLGSDLPTDFPEDDIAKTEDLITLLEIEAQKFDTHNPGKWINNQAPSIPDVSVDEFLQQQNIIKDTLPHLLLTLGSRGLFGLEPAKLGMHYLLDLLKQGHGFISLISEDSTGAQYLRIKDGTSTIAQHMAAELPRDSFLLSSPVTQIIQHNTSVTIHTQSGHTITAKKVILTVPSHTYTYIDFVPPLSPRELALATRTLRGHYAKTLVTYATAWWRDLGLVGKLQSTAPGPLTMSWELSTPGTGPHSLALFSCAQDYDALFANTTALQRQDAMLADLARIVEAAVGEGNRRLVYDVIEYKEQDWYGKAYIEGAPMAAMGPGDFAKLAPVLRERERHVHFGGTETAGAWKGYLEGAVEAGERAAGEVVELLRANGIE